MFSPLPSNALLSITRLVKSLVHTHHNGFRKHQLPKLTHQPQPQRLTQVGFSIDRYYFPLLHSSVERRVKGILIGLLHDSCLSDVASTRAPSASTHDFRVRFSALTDHTSTPRTNGRPQPERVSFAVREETARLRNSFGYPRKFHRFFFGLACSSIQPKDFSVPDRLRHIEYFASGTTLFAPFRDLPFPFDFSSERLG